MPMSQAGLSFTDGEGWEQSRQKNKCILFILNSVPGQVGTGGQNNRQISDGLALGNCRFRIGVTIKAERILVWQLERSCLGSWLLALSSVW